MSGSAFTRSLPIKLLEFRYDRKPLLEMVRSIYEKSVIKMPKLERDNELVDIDPFTFFGLFNKSSMRDENRVKIMTIVAELCEVKTPVPKFFEGIPVLNNQNATFYYFVGDRADCDIEELWQLFEAALIYSKDPSDNNKEALAKYFDLAINKKGNGNSKITMGLYWIAPDTFLNFDQRNIWYIYDSGKIPADVVKSLPKAEYKISFNKYFEIAEKLRAYLQSDISILKDFKELSFEALIYSQEVNEQERD